MFVAIVVGGQAPLLCRQACICWRDNHVRRKIVPRGLLPNLPVNRPKLKASSPATQLPQLTLLAPEIVETILEGKRPKRIQLRAAGLRRGRILIHSFVLIEEITTGYC
jgi:hypothetical protein